MTSSKDYLYERRERGRMKPKTEQTSKRVAQIAAKVLNATGSMGDSELCHCAIHKACREMHITVADLKALAASCLTQAPDKKARKR
jgi:hypothetical protein